MVTRQPICLSCPADSASDREHAKSGTPHKAENMCEAPPPHFSMQSCCNYRITGRVSRQYNTFFRLNLQQQTTMTS